MCGRKGQVVAVGGKVNECAVQCAGGCDGFIAITLFTRKSATLGLKDRPTEGNISESVSCICLFRPRRVEDSKCTIIIVISSSGSSSTGSDVILAVPAAKGAESSAAEKKPGNVKCFPYILHETVVVRGGRDGRQSLPLVRGGNGDGAHKF